ncbi:MAG: hypothetical protein ABEI96_03185 [Haloarculaceae archaeon]
MSDASSVERTDPNESARGATAPRENRSAATTSQGRSTTTSQDRAAATPTEHDRAPERIREHGEAVRQRQLDAALAKLRSRGDLDDEHRQAVADLSEALVSSLLERPEAAASAADGATAERIADLLVPEE